MICELNKKYDPCQRSKSKRKRIAPFGEVEETTFPFAITSMDVTGPYPLTPRMNKYLLKFIDHFAKYVQAFPFQNRRPKRVL